MMVLEGGVILVGLIAIVGLFVRQLVVVLRDEYRDVRTRL